MLGRREDERTGGREYGDLPGVRWRVGIALPSAASLPVRLTHSEHLTAMWMTPAFTSVFPCEVIKKQTKPTNHHQ